MMRLLFIRHAQTTANHEGRWQGHTDTPLSTLGQQQARCLAEGLFTAFKEQGVQPGVIYSSPLGRAQATSAAIATAFSLPIKTLADLSEYHVGVFSARTWPELEAEHPAVARRFAAERDWNAVPEAETLQSRERRASAVVEYLLATHGAGDTVLCVTHGGFLQYLLSAVLDTRRIWGVRPHNTAIFEFELTPEGHAETRESPAGLSTYRCRILRFNDTQHLAGLADLKAGEAD
ncbi:histidine phosphatase family protein [Spiribacter onubensis]|uniref:Histidine phosphatase family protein n=1 Tax=Spiribacter onubensis TaxID=3122420 RepID=A0ABV3S7E7_9GAMM